MKINLKKATLDDANMIGEVFDLYRIFYNQVPDISVAQQYIAERLKNNESTIFFVEENGVCLGFDSVNVRKKIVLYDLFVREEYRRRGIAESLMNAAKEYASQNNFGSIELSTNKTNLPGQTLYESLGYIRDNEFYSYDLEI